MKTLALFVAAAALAVGATMTAGAANQARPRHTKAELADLVRKAIKWEKQALKDMDKGTPEDVKKDLKKSLSALNEAEPDTSGTTGADLRQAINKDEFARDNAGNRREKSLARSKINQAIIKKEAALHALEPHKVAPRPANKAPTLKKMHAEFVTGDKATFYTIDATDPDGDKLTYRWSFELKLVDPAGALPYSGAPPPGATVDPTCKDAGVEEDAQGNKIPDEFSWYHGDEDGCDHTRMGPKGHQGVIKVVVSDGHWNCTATYEGTNTGDGPAPQSGNDPAHPCAKAG